MIKFNESLIEHKNAIVENINILQKENMQSFSEVRKDITKVDENINDVKNKVYINKANIDKLDAGLDNTTKQTSENYSEIKTLYNIKTNLETYNDQILKFEKNFAHLRFEIEEVSNKIKDTDCFIDKHLPIKTQAQISSTLHTCLGKKDRKLLFL